MKRSATCWMALALGLLDSPARADVVAPEVASCQHGGTPSSCQAGPFCALEECQTDADCTAGNMACRELAVCVGKVLCAGLLPPDANLSESERATVEGSCSGGESCPAHSSCGSRRVCALTVPAHARKKKDDGGCAVRGVGAQPDAPSSLAAILGLAVLAQRRRRPASPHRRKLLQHPLQ